MIFKCIIILNMINTAVFYAENDKLTFLNFIFSQLLLISKLWICLDKTRYSQYNSSCCVSSRYYWWLNTFLSMAASSISLANQQLHSFSCGTVFVTEVLVPVNDMFLLSAVGTTSNTTLSTWHHSAGRVEESSMDNWPHRTRWLIVKGSQGHLECQPNWRDQSC